MKRPNRWRRWFAAVFAIAALLILYRYLQPRASEYSRFTSPDGNYAVVVYRIPSLFAMMPGQEGDAKGFVRLIDAEGRILQERPVEMVNTINFVEWKPGFVYFGPFPEWPLPPLLKPKSEKP